MKSINKLLSLSIMLYVIPVSAQEHSVSDKKNPISALSEKLYFTVFGGEAFAREKVSNQNIKPTKPKTSSVYGMGLGCFIKKNIRVEINFSKFRNFKLRATEKFEDENEPGTIITARGTQNFKSNLFAANFYYDFINKTNFLPYITAGVGIARNQASTHKVNFSNNDDIRYNPGRYNHIYPSKVTNNFAWNIGAGLSYQASNKIILNVINYKFHHLGKFRTKDGVPSIERLPGLKAKLSAHSITTGVSINFDIFQ